jgi:Immunity protein 35
MNKEQLLKLADNYIAEMQKEPNGEIELMRMPDYWDEFDSGYVFGYQSKKFIETSNEKYAIIGNPPLIIDKISGKIYGTSFRFSRKDFEKIYDKLRDNPSLYNEILNNMDLLSNDESLRQKCISVLRGLNLDYDHP